MSYFPTHKIRDFRHPAILCEERAVFALAFADRQQSPEDLITASIGTIADDAGVSRKTAQRIVSWGISVGILSMHIRNGFRCYGFHLEALLGLPTDLARNKLRVGPPVPSSGPAVPPEGPADLGQQGESMGPAVPPMGPPVLVQCPPVPCSVSPGPPKGQSRTKSRDNQGTISATVPARAEAPIGAPLVLGYGQTDPSTPTTIPAPLVARPEASKASSESLPVDDSNPPPKGTRKASKKHASPATDRASRWPDDFVLDAEMVAYAINRGMAGPAQVADEFERFENYHKSKGSKFVNWKLAFYNWVRNWEERKNKSAPFGKQNRSFSQVEPDEDFWTNRDNDLAEDYRS